MAVFMEFLGHGACGVNTKASWLPYFHVFGISDAWAWPLMRVVGTMDIALGVAVLLAPRRALLLYMAIWGCFTALLRPLAGEGGWEFIERAYNYGVPFTLLLLYGFGPRLGGWFVPLKVVPSLSEERARTLLWGMRLIVALMLIGHGGFGAVMAKRNLLGFYGAAGLGVFNIPLETIRSGIGFFEIGLGVAVLVTIGRSLLAFIFAWKLATECLYLVAGAQLACWEVIERGGSYAAPLAALCLLQAVRAWGNSPVSSTRGASRHCAGSVGAECR
ncbi:MAG: hypothetical protein HY274_00530 [Gammaproteobacteria bacterium]|nr:hypothetical protein [Gammaproteobacteria bacterium]